MIVQLFLTVGVWTSSEVLILMLIQKAKEDSHWYHAVLVATAAASVPQPHNHPTQDNIVPAQKCPRVGFVVLIF